ncbi:MAG TPA: SDR family NAD(P)-dependent oxidoreductase [Candidatus Obscuribacterales bacterium]
MLSEPTEQRYVNKLPPGRELAGKVAWVTGASRGIGRAIAIALAARGAALAIGARNAEALAGVRGSIESLGSSCFAAPLDVRDGNQVESFAQQIAAHLGAPDILVNNAGIYRTEPVRGHSLHVWQETIETNLTSALLTSRCVIDGMAAKGWGRIINIASISGKVAEAYGAAYSASKFGLIGLTQALALEVARLGITVNAVCPGWVKTDMAAEQLSDERWCRLNSLDTSEAADLARLSVPQERFIAAEEVADLVAFLCSGAARGITGQAINICGGMALY